MTYKEAREAKGLKAQFVAAQLGMTKANYSLKENYKRNFKTDEIYKFAEIVGIRIDQLKIKEDS